MPCERSHPRSQPVPAIPDPPWFNISRAGISLTPVLYHQYISPALPFCHQIENQDGCTMEENYSPPIMSRQVMPAPGVSDNAS